MIFDETYLTYSRYETLSTNLRKVYNFRPPLQDLNFEEYYLTITIPIGSSPDFPLIHYNFVGYLVDYSTAEIASEDLYDSQIQTYFLETKNYLQPQNPFMHLLFYYHQHVGIDTNQLYTDYIRETFLIPSKFYNRNSYPYLLLFSSANSLPDTQISFHSYYKYQI